MRKFFPKEVKIKKITIILFFSINFSSFSELNIKVDKDIPSLRKPNFEVYIQIEGEKIYFTEDKEKKVYTAKLSNVPFMETYRIYYKDGLIDNKKCEIYSDSALNRARNKTGNIYNISAPISKFNYDNTSQYTIDYYLWLYGPWFVMDENYIYFAETRAEKSIHIFKLDYKKGEIALQKKLPLNKFGPMAIDGNGNIYILIEEKILKRIKTEDLSLDENFNLNLQISGISILYNYEEGSLYLFGKSIGKKENLFIYPLYKIDLITGKVDKKTEFFLSAVTDDKTLPPQMCFFDKYIVGAFHCGWDWYQIRLIDIETGKEKLLTSGLPFNDFHHGNPQYFILTGDINKETTAHILSCWVLSDGTVWIRASWSEKGDNFLPLGKIINENLVLPETKIINNFELESGVAYLKEDIEKIKEIVKKDAVVLFDIECDEYDTKLAERLAEQLNLAWAYSGIGYFEGNRYSNILLETTSIPIVIGNSEKEILMKKFLLENHLLIWDKWEKKAKSRIAYFPLFPSFKKPIILIDGKTYSDRKKAVNFLISKLKEEIKKTEDAYIFASDSYRRIYYWQRSPSKEKIILKGAKREYLSAQIGITAYKTLTEKDFSIIGTKLTGEKGEVPEPQIRYVGFVPKKFSDWFINFYKDKNQMKEYWEHQPDPLFLDKPEKIEKNKTQPIWLTYYIPENIPAGIYKGEVLIKAGNISKSIPVELEVRDFALPKNNPLRVYSFYIPEQIPLFLDADKDDEEWFSVFKNVSKSYAEHGQTVGVHDCYREIKWIVQEDGEINFDYSLFDRVWKMFEELGMGQFQILHRLVPKNIGYLWNGKKVILNQSSLNFKKAKENFLFDFVSHLEKMCWKDKAIIYTIDEPHDYDLAIRTWEQWNKLGIKTICALNYYPLKEMERIKGKLNIFIPQYQFYGPNSPYHGSFDFFEELLKEGEEVWWYECSCGNPDMKINSFLTDIRYMVWATFKYGLKGFAPYGGGNRWPTRPEYLGVNLGPPNFKVGDNWVYDPYTFTTEGLDFNQYPDYKRKSIVETIRTENLRDCFQDYMYLWVLKEEIKKAKDKGKDVSEIEKRMNEIINGLIPTIMPFGKPKIEDYLKAKEEIAEMILKLQDKN